MVFLHRYWLLQNPPSSPDHIRYSYPSLDGLSPISGRSGKFSCSVDMSLPELRLHLYTEGSILSVEPLYRPAIPMDCPGTSYIDLRAMRANLISQTIPNISSPVEFHDASDDGFLRSHIQARLAASSKIRVLRLCLHFPWGFTQSLAQGPLHAQFVARALR